MISAIESVRSNFCLTVEAGPMVNGAAVQQKVCGGADNQKLEILALSNYDNS
ncbi:MAG: RICIN domain-containing protein [Burkholderiaceae bacterium]